MTTPDRPPRLRPYQSDAVDAFRLAFEEGRVTLPDDATLLGEIEAANRRPDFSGIISGRMSARNPSPSQLPRSPGFNPTRPRFEFDNAVTEPRFNFENAMTETVREPARPGLTTTEVGERERAVRAAVDRLTESFSSIFGGVMPGDALAQAASPGVLTVEELERRLMPSGGLVRDPRDGRSRRDSFAMLYGAGPLTLTDLDLGPEDIGPAVPGMALDPPLPSVDAAPVNTRGRKRQVK